jgi:hypothetical protein
LPKRWRKSKRKLGAEHHGFRIVAVHVEDRRTDHLGDVGAVERGTRVVDAMGGEADLVVDHHMHGAADREAACLRHLEQFHHHALPGKRGVAVDQHRHDLFALSSRRGLGAHARCPRPPGR